MQYIKHFVHFAIKIVTAFSYYQVVPIYVKITIINYVKTYYLKIVKAYYARMSSIVFSIRIYVT